MTREIPQHRRPHFDFQRLLPIADWRLTTEKLSGTSVFSGQSSIRAALLFLSAICVLSAPVLAQQRRKVIVDQDAAGPGGSNLQAIMLLVKSPAVDTLGIAVVTGDAWRDEEITHVMRVLELEGRTDIPVLPGAAFPLVHTREEAVLDEELYGKINYMGAWDPRWWHQPFEVPATNVPEGMPKSKPSTEDAAHFMIRMVHQYPHQVTIVGLGPMTDLAIATRIDHQFPELAQELVFMGGGINPQSNDAEWESDPRHEFNFWFDPEAAHIVLTSHWAKITCIPVDISIKTHFTHDLADQIARSGTPLGTYWVKYYIPYINYMWDELAAAAWIDPSIITSEKEFSMDVNLDRGANYGDTITWLKQDKPKLSGVPVHVLLDLNLEKFNQLFVDTMSLPGSHLTAP